MLTERMLIDENPLVAMFARPADFLLEWSGSLQVKHSKEETVGAEPTPDHQ